MRKKITSSRKSLLDLELYQLIQVLNTTLNSLKLVAKSEIIAASRSVSLARSSLFLCAEQMVAGGGGESDGRAVLMARGSYHPHSGLPAGTVTRRGGAACTTIQLQCLVLISDRWSAANRVCGRGTTGRNDVTSNWTTRTTCVAAQVQCSGLAAGDLILIGCTTRD